MWHQCLNARIWTGANDSPGGSMPNRRHQPWRVGAPRANVYCYVRQVLWSKLLNNHVLMYDLKWQRHLESVELQGCIGVNPQLVWESRCAVAIEFIHCLQESGLEVVVQSWILVIHWIQIKNGFHFSCEGSSTISCLARLVKVKDFCRMFFFVRSACWSLICILRHMHSEAEADMNLTLMYFTVFSHLRQPQIRFEVAWGNPKGIMWESMSI